MIYEKFHVSLILTLYASYVDSPARKLTRETCGSADQSMKKPILVSLILFRHPLNALMLEAPTAR